MLLCTATDIRVLHTVRHAEAGHRVITACHASSSESPRPTRSQTVPRISGARLHRLPQHLELPKDSANARLVAAAWNDQDLQMVYCQNMATSDRCCYQEGGDVFGYWTWICNNMNYLQWDATHCPRNTASDPTTAGRQ